MSLFEIDFRTGAHLLLAKEETREDVKFSLISREFWPLEGSAIHQPRLLFGAPFDLCYYA